MRTRSAILVAVVMVLAVLAGTWLLLGWLTPAGDLPTGHAGADPHPTTTGVIGAAPSQSQGQESQVGERTNAPPSAEAGVLGQDTETEPANTNVSESIDPVEELFAPLEKLANKLQAQTWRHSPTGTGTEAFYLSLPDDGEVWARVAAVGTRLGTAFDDEDGDTALRMLSKARDAASYRGIAHLELTQELTESLPLLAETLKPILEAQLPKDIYLMPTKAQRVSGNHQRQVVEPLRAFDALRLHTLALLRSDQPIAGKDALERLVELGHSLRGTTLLDMMIILQVRRYNLALLTGCYEAKLIDSDLIKQLHSSYINQSHDMESVLIGEAVEMLASIEKIKRDPDLQSYTLEQIEELVDDFESGYLWIGQALDPDTLEGRIYRGGNGIKLSELEQLSDKGLMKSVLTRLFMETCHWDLLHSFDRPMSDFTEEGRTSANMVDLMRMLRGGAWPTSGGGGGLTVTGRSSRGIRTSRTLESLRMTPAWPVWNLIPDVRLHSYVSVIPEKSLKGSEIERIDKDDLPKHWFTSVFAGSSKPVRLRLVQYNGPTGKEDKAELVLGEIFTSYEETLVTRKPSEGK